MLGRKKKREKLGKEREGHREKCNGCRAENKKKRSNFFFIFFEKIQAPQRPGYYKK